MWLVLGVLVWLALGVLDAGLVYAYFMREFPPTAKEHEVERHTWRFAMFCIAAGPVGLPATFLVFGIKHGWTLRRPNWTWIALQKIVLGEDTP